MKRNDPQNYKHVEICKLALEDAESFNNFKRNPNFTKILEHTTVNFGNVYIDLMGNEYNDIIQKLNWGKLKENDNMGNPKIHEYYDNINYPDEIPKTGPFNKLILQR